MAANSSSTPFLTIRGQQLLPAVVAVLVVAILAGLGDVVVTAMVSQSVGVQYRFQVIGLLLASAPQISVLLSMIAGISILGGHRVAVRMASIVAMAAGVIYLPLLPLFGLDMLEQRRLVSDTAIKGFTMAGMKTAGFAGWFALLLLWVGWRAFQASVKPDEGEARARGEGLVVGQG